MPLTEGAERPPESRPQSLARRWGMPVAIGIAFVGLAVLIGAWWLWADQAAGWGYDFRAYYEAALRLDETGSPYQSETLAGPFRPGPFGLYLYSPPLAIAITPLTVLGEQSAVLVWFAFRVGILALTSALMPVSRPIRLATFGVAGVSAPVLHDLNLGNVSVIVTFAGAVAWRWLDRPIASLAIAMATALRPTMALVVGWWALRRKWRAVTWTAAAAFAIVLVTLVVVPVRVWFDYLTVLRNIGDVTGVERNVDLGSAFLLLGGPEWLAPLVLVAGYAVAIGAVVLSLRRDAELSFIVTVSATLLLSPLLWDHYLAQLVLPAAFLASRGRPWALALPLLGWLPEPLLPFVATAPVLLPFLAKPPAEPGEESSVGENRPSIVDAPSASVGLVGSG